MTRAPPKSVLSIENQTPNLFPAGEKNPPRGNSIFLTFSLHFVGYICNQLVTSTVRTTRWPEAVDRRAGDSATRWRTGPGPISTGNVGFGTGELRFVGGGLQRLVTELVTIIVTNWLQQVDPPSSTTPDRPRSPNLKNVGCYHLQTHKKTIVFDWDV